MTMPISRIRNVLSTKLSRTKGHLFCVSFFFFLLPFNGTLTWRNAPRRKENLRESPLSLLSFDWLR